MTKLAVAIAMVGSLGLAHQAAADSTITTFDNFTSDALYASWGDSATVIVSGTTNYSVTATGYGSNYKYIGFPVIKGLGNTNIELDITLSGPAAADGQLGPIIDLLDADGTQYSYRWYGQTLGHHVLTMPIEKPTVVVAAGTTPGLDLANLQHMHMQLDPGAFGVSGAYTLQWNNLQLTGAPKLKITGVSYNMKKNEVTLTWNSAPGATYTVMLAYDMSSGFMPVISGIASGGASTTTTVVLQPDSESYFEIQQE